MVVLCLFCLELLVCVALGWPIVAVLLVGLVLFVGWALRQGYGLRAVGGMLWSGIRTAKNVLIVFLLIGVLTALWRACGTVPLLICYAVDLIHPGTLVITSFLLTCAVSALMGTSFGAAATMGAVCMTAAASMGVLLPDLKSAPNATARNKVIDSYIAKIPELKEVILPVLRRADFFVFYTVPTTVQEDVQLTYFVPQLTEKTPAVTAQTNWQLLNDLAVMAINNKEYSKAQKILEAAVALKQDATVNNNLGVIHAQMGHKREAAQYFDKAKIRKEARYNMGLILMQNGEYAKAIPYLKDKPNINLAYAQLMNNDNRAALETFRKIKMQNAMDYYMQAVAAARIKDTKEMAVSLQKAIQMQPDLKNWAATDISFYPYKGDPVYMQIVK